MIRGQRSVAAAFFLVLAFVGAPVSADERDGGATASEGQNRFVLGVGGVYADFSTTFEQVRSGSGLRIFVSLEGNLGLPASQTVPTLNLLARVGRKSYVAANLGRFRRSETLLELDEELTLDDLVVEVGARVDLFFNVTDLDVAYGHAYLNDERVRIIGTFGASLLDLDIGVVADGSYRLGNVSESGTYEVSSSLLVPVPLVGVLFDVNLTDAWVLSSAVDFFYLPVGDITAQAWRARINARYAINRTVAVHLGYSTFDIEVIDTTQEAKSTITYDMDGFTAGLIFSF